MKKLLFVVALCLGLGFTTSAHAALIDLKSVTPLSEMLLYKIYNAVYGTFVANNDALEALEDDLAIGGGLYKTSTGYITLIARYASLPVTLKSYSGITGPGPGDTTIVANLAGTGMLYTPPYTQYTVSPSSNFGVWGSTSAGKWYSEKSRNWDNQYHFIVLRTPVPNTVLVGFEDRTFNEADWDYNDFVFEAVYFENYTPEPSSMILLGIGLLGFGGRLRKRFKA